MRILWLTENYPPSGGGMAQSCDRIVASLRKKGVIIDILHFSNRRKPFIKTININGSYTALPVFDDLPHTLNLSYQYIASHIDRSAIDFMVVFGGFISMSSCVVFSQLLDLPYYLCLRGNDFDISLFSHKRREMLLDALKNARGALSVCTSKQQKIAKLLPGIKSHYTPNGIDLDSWAPLKSERQFAIDFRKQHKLENQRVLGFFGALKNKKGVAFFLGNLKNIATRKNCYLLFSGDIEPAVADELKNVGCDYYTLPFLDRSELVKYYLVCDWVVIPSFYDGMPNVMLEAGGLAKPILATAVDGMIDVIEHKQDGILYPVLSEQACRYAIKRCLQMNHQECQQLGQHLQTKIIRDYTADTEAEKYLTIFTEDGYHV